MIPELVHGSNTGYCGPLPLLGIDSLGLPRGNSEHHTLRNRLPMGLPGTFVRWSTSTPYTAPHLWRKCVST